MCIGQTNGHKSDNLGRQHRKVSRVEQKHQGAMSLLHFWVVPGMPGGSPMPPRSGPNQLGPGTALAWGFGLEFGWGTIQFENPELPFPSLSLYVIRVT